MRPRQRRAVIPAFLVALSLARPAAAALSSAPGSACPFCAIPAPELITQTPQYSLKPTQGMMGVEGYVLLIPTAHVPSFADLSREEHAALARSAAEATRAVAAAYAPPLLLEHGVTGQSVGHAHLHIVPGLSFERVVAETERLLRDGGESAVREDFALEQAWERTAAARASAGGYLFVADPAAGRAALFAVAPRAEHRMILRRAAAATLGREHLADWAKARSNADLLEADETLRRRTIQTLAPRLQAR